MKPNKAPGDSGIAKEDFEIAGDHIDELVKILANKAFQEQRWPTELKTQVICPLPKKPDKKDTIKIDETRPISLLEVLDKWLQRIIYNRIE